MNEQIEAAAKMGSQDGAADRVDGGYDRKNNMKEAFREWRITWQRAYLDAYKAARD